TQESVPPASGSATRGQMCSLDQGRPLSGGGPCRLSDHFVSTRSAHLPVVTATSSESSTLWAWVTAYYACIPR
ncbi:hypothetical protein KL921_000001, partial [Ogataea angusta]